jgi:plasmid stability protein
MRKAPMVHWQQTTEKRSVPFMPSLQVRDLPDHIYQQIVTRAREERRSISQETIMLLAKALELPLQGGLDRKQLLSEIAQEAELLCFEELPDPVTLVREDRQR